MQLHTYPLLEYNLFDYMEGLHRSPSNCVIFIGGTPQKLEYFVIALLSVEQVAETKLGSIS